MIIVNLSILSQLFPQNFCKLGYLVCRIIVILLTNLKNLACSFHLKKELISEIIIKCYNRKDPLMHLIGLRLGCFDWWNHLMY